MIARRIRSAIRALLPALVFVAWPDLAFADENNARKWLRYLQDSEGVLAEAGPRGDTVQMQIVGWRYDELLETPDDHFKPREANPSIIVDVAQATKYCSRAAMLLHDMSYWMTWTVKAGRDYGTRYELLKEQQEQYTKVRADCDRASAFTLGPNRLAHQLNELLPSRVKIDDPPLPFISRAEVVEFVKQLATLESAMLRAANERSVQSFSKTTVPIHRYVLGRNEFIRHEYRFATDEPSIEEHCGDAAKRVYHVNWSLGRAISKGSVHNWFPRTLVDPYRRAKAACAKVLGLASEDGLVAIAVGALGPEERQ